MLAASLLRSWIERRKRRPRSLPLATPRPSLEALEERFVLSHAGASMVDPANGMWYLSDLNQAGPRAPVFSFGYGGWQPVVGDWDGSGADSVGMFDPSTATFYLRNENSAGAADGGVFSYGLPGWVALAGNWGGGAASGVGAFDP